MGTTVSLDVDGVAPSLARVLADETFAYLHGAAKIHATVHQLWGWERFHPTTDGQLRGS